MQTYNGDISVTLNNTVGKKKQREYFKAQEFVKKIFKTSDYCLHNQLKFYSSIVLLLYNIKIQLRVQVFKVINQIETKLAIASCNKVYSKT